MTPTRDTAELAQLPDEELMLLIARGIIEEPATELFRRHNRGLFNFLAWLSQGNTGEAEDIAQKTWVKLMTRCADYRPSAAFRTYLYQIARNTWLDVQRSAYEAQREELDEEHEHAADEDLSPDLGMQLRQQQHRVRDALMKLPPAQREVVLLRFFNDMSLEEIAATVGEGFETVKSRLRYAFGKLRRDLEEVS